MNKYNVDEMVEELFSNKDIQKEIISIMENFNYGEVTIKDSIVINIAPMIYDFLKDQQFSSEFIFCYGFILATKMNEVIDNYLKNKFEGIIS